MENATVNTKNAKTDDPRKSIKKWLVLLLLLLLLLAGILLLIMKPWVRPVEALVSGNYNTGTLDLGDDSLKAYLQDMADQNNVTIQLNTKPVFQSGRAQGDFLIQNAEENRFDMRVEIYLDGDLDKQVYDSGQIPPGAYIDKAPLETVLAKGEHAALAYVSFYEGENLVTTSSVDMTLVIQT